MKSKREPVETWGFAAGQVLDGLGDGLGDRVHDAWEWVDLDRLGGVGGRLAEGGVLGDGVGEEACEDAVQVGGGEGRLNQVDLGGGHALDGVAQARAALDGLGAASGTPGLVRTSMRWRLGGGGVGTRR